MSDKQSSEKTKSGLSQADSQSLKVAMQKAREKAKKDNKKMGFKEVL